MHAHKCTHALALHKHPLGQATCRCWMALQFHVLDKHSSCHAAQHKQAAQLPNKQCPTPAHAGVLLLLLLPRHPKCRWSHFHVAPVLVAHSCSRQCWADGGAARGCRFQARGQAEVGLQGTAQQRQYLRHCASPCVSLARSPQEQPNRQGPQHAASSGLTCCCTAGAQHAPICLAHGPPCSSSLESAQQWQTQDKIAGVGVVLCCTLHHYRTHARAALFRTSKHWVRNRDASCTVSCTRG